MAKLRKMLGDTEAQVCKELMALIGTQGKRTLEGWAVGYAGQKYLAAYERQGTGDGRMAELWEACSAYTKGGESLVQAKQAIKEMRQIAQGLSGNPAAQAAARAVATACATIQTPSNAFGFLLYGAAAAAYDVLGLERQQQEYDAFALQELGEALACLQKAAVPDEAAPVKINWNC